jgi:hypothetical protein
MTRICLGLILRKRLTRQLESLAPRARFELATLRLTAEEVENLSALSGVVYKKIGAIFPSLAAPNPAPKISRKRKTYGNDRW